MRGTSHAGPRLIARFSDAVGRRGRVLVAYHHRRRQAAGRGGLCLTWLRNLAGDAEGIAPTCGSSAVCPGLSAAAIGTFFHFGETELAVRSRRLITLQKRDGSLPDAGLLHGSLFNTAQAARAWSLLIEADSQLLPEAEAALRSRVRRSRRSRHIRRHAARVGERRLVRAPGPADRSSRRFRLLGRMGHALEHAGLARCSRSRRQSNLAN